MVSNTGLVFWEEKATLPRSARVFWAVRGSADAPAKDYLLALLAGGGIRKP